MISMLDVCYKCEKENPKLYSTFGKKICLECLEKRKTGRKNNSIFRIVNNLNIKNLGTRILKIFRNEIKKDYKLFYNTEILGLITFVEPPRTGAIYKADNWIYLGETKGVEVRRKGADWMNKQ